MLNYNDAFYQLLPILKEVYDDREAAAIAHEVMEYVTGLSKTERIVKKMELLTQLQHTTYIAAKEALALGKPLQYVTGTAWFMNRPFIVNEHVLIPRPETEELVDWIVKDNAGKPITILDIGTGSGCIPVSLKLEMPTATITSCDISNDALLVATENAKQLNAAIHFLQLDFLDTTAQDVLPAYDVIVSNPPYIPQYEMQNMHSNVKDHEPHLALFVPDNEPLLFYKAIAAFGHTHLKEHGAIYCELHADHARQTEQMFRDEGYTDVLLRDDMHGNPRMLRACKK